MPEPPRFRQSDDLRPSPPRHNDRLARELEDIEEALDLLREEAARRADLELLSAVDLCERLLRLMGFPPGSPRPASSAAEGRSDSPARKPGPPTTRAPEKPGHP